MPEPQPKMVISRLWFQFSVITFLIGFSILGYLAYRICVDHPPVPARVVVATDGRVLFTGDDIMAGQHLFQKYGLMQYGRCSAMARTSAPISPPSTSTRRRWQMIAF